MKHLHKFLFSLTNYTSTSNYYSGLALLLLITFAQTLYAQVPIKYDYDKLDRLSKITYQNDIFIDYLYDSAGNRISIKVSGVEFKADVTPRPAGKKNGTIARADWDQMGRFAMGLDAVNTNELQRADSAPFNSSGDGKVDVFDWVQAGRFFAGLDDLVPAASGVVAALAMPATIKTEAGTRAVRIVSTTLQRGQVNEIKIESDAQGDENALAFSLNFDPALFTFTNATLGAGATGAQLIVNPNQAASGRVGFGIALNPNQTFAAGTKSLLTLQFQATSGNATATAISFGDQPVVRGVADIYANSLSTMYTDATLTVNGDTKPAPAITTINPTTAVAGSAGFTLTVTGKDFANTAVIYWGSKPLPTNFSSSTQLLGSVTAAELTSATTVNVTVVNPAPSSATSNAVSFIITPSNIQTMTLPLVQGLNLISFSVQPGDTAIAKVLDTIKGKFSSVWAWNSTSKKYEGYFPNQPIFLSDLLTMQAGRGYWVIMDTPATLTVSGATPGKTITLEVGTNLVGFNGSTQKPIAEVLSTITGKFSSVWAWNNTSKKYEGYFPNQPLFLSDLSVMEPGRGYFIIVTQKTDWIVP